MELVIPGLYATSPQPLSFDTSLVVRGFLLQRENGNLLIYSASTVDAEEKPMREMGGVLRQYLDHHHEAAPSCDWVARTFDAPLHCHENDRAEASQSCHVDATFSERHLFGRDFEIIPTPGHTSGATTYLWDTGQHRCLFTGDTIYLHGESEWAAAVLASSDRDTYISSLELIRDLDFDVLVPWVASAGENFYAVTDKDDTRRRIDTILERLRHGTTS